MTRQNDLHPRDRIMEQHRLAAAPDGGYVRSLALGQRIRR